MVSICPNASLVWAYMKSMFPAFKAVPQAEKDRLPESAEEALSQMELKSYQRDLEDRGVTDIVRYGIAFSGMTMHMKPKVIHSYIFDQLKKFIHIFWLGPGMVRYRNTDIMDAFTLHKLLFGHAAFSLIFPPCIILLR